MPFDVCTRELDRGAAELFGMDPQVVSVGIVAMPGGFGFVVRRTSDPSIVPLRRLDPRTTSTVRGVPIVIHELSAPIVPLLELPTAAANGPAPASTPEQQRHYLTRLATDTVGSFCLSEWGSGSDVRHVTRVTR